MRHPRQRRHRLAARQRGMHAHILPRIVKGVPREQRLPHLPETHQPRTHIRRVAGDEHLLAPRIQHHRLPDMDADKRGVKCNVHISKDRAARVFGRLPDSATELVPLFTQNISRSAPLALHV